MSAMSEENRVREVILDTLSVHDYKTAAFVLAQHELYTLCDCGPDEPDRWPCGCGKEHNCYNWHYRWSKNGLHWKGGHWRLECIEEQVGIRAQRLKDYHERLAEEGSDEETS